jgi:alginate O-acetyltransferase complex protein AlgI
MLFTDPFFLFYFLPLSLLALRFCALGNRFGLAAKTAVIAGTLVFYAHGNLLWPLLFLVVIGGTYAFSLLILSSERPVVRRIGMIGSVAYAVAILALLKYLNWLVSLFPALTPLHAALVPYFGAEGSIVLPPGISFFVFEALSFSIDAYRGKLHRPIKLIDYVTFLAMFPRFIAGPIVRYADMAAQFDAWPGLQLRRGLTVFALGFCIKSLFADQFAVFVPYAFSVARPDLIQSWTGAVAYTFQLYFDFWGYSLMATGLGLCLGFAFPDNFRSPYRATSITQFWQRWHMTLSSWLRDYLYISMGGNRCKPWRVYLNLFLTMLIGGLWHGANFTFVIWGAYHGVLLIVERLIGESTLARIPALVRRALTLLLVLVGWVLFRSDSFDQAGQVLTGMVGGNGVGMQFSPTLLNKHSPALLLALAGWAFWIWGEPRVVGDSPMHSREFATGTQWLLFALFALALLFSVSSSQIPFLYFQF